MKILIVDKHILFRDGLASMLSEQHGFNVVGSAGTADEALRKTRAHIPDVILLNIYLPDGNGIDLIGEILDLAPKAKIVILTESEDNTHLLAAIREGAKGFLRKNIPGSELVKSIRALDHGQAAITRKMTGFLVEELNRVGKAASPDKAGIKHLTFREEEVLKCLGAGFSNHEIADKLSISNNTVRVHVHRILKKLNLRNRREAYHFVRK